MLDSHTKRYKNITQEVHADDFHMSAAHEDEETLITIIQSSAEDLMRGLQNECGLQLSHDKAVTIAITDKLAEK